MFPASSLVSILPAEFEDSREVDLGTSVEADSTVVAKGGLELEGVFRFDFGNDENGQGCCFGLICPGCVQPLTEHISSSCSTLSSLFSHSPRLIEMPHSTSVRGILDDLGETFDTECFVLRSSMANWTYEQGGEFPTTNTYTYRTKLNYYNITTIQ